MIGETITVYILVVAIRLVVITLLYPILQRTGYGVDWKTALVMLWGGLRGAVGLALALGWVPEIKAREKLATRLRERRRGSNRAKERDRERD